MAVYFIRSPHGFKIGYSENVRARLAQLRTGSQFPLELVAVIPAGTRAVEQEIHRVLAPYRAEGEWFKPSALVRYAAHQASKGWGPSLPVHVRVLIEHALKNKAERIRAGHLPNIPRALRGTDAERTIMDLDAFIRSHALPYPPELGKAFAAMRNLSRGKSVDTSQISGFNAFRSSITASGGAQPRLDPE